jgi:hypothetical protein
MDTMMPDSPSGSERSKVERAASTVERSGKLIRQFNHKGLTEVSNRQTSQSVSPSINFEGRSSVVATDGQERVLKDPNSIMMPKIDARQLEVSVDYQKNDLNKRVEKLNQQTNQFKVQMSTAGQSGQVSSASSPVHEPVLNVRQQKHFNRSLRKTDDRAVRPVLQASSESMHPISDSRQTNIGLPSRVGQVAKTDMSMLEQSVIEDSKQGKDRVNEVSDKASRHEAKFDKQAQAGGFLESNHSQSVSTNKGTTATLNQSTPVLMQRMLDTIQDLKQSQNAQRVSFELDLAQGEKLKVRLQLSGDQVKSIFTTDSNTLKLLIRDNWDQLQRQVESEGFDLAQPDFTDRNSQQSFDTEEHSTFSEAFQGDLNKTAASEESKEKDDSDVRVGDKANNDAKSEVIRYA